MLLILALIATKLYDVRGDIVQYTHIV